VPRRIASVLGVGSGRARLHDLAAHAPREPDELALDARAVVLEQRAGLRVTAEDDPDLLEDRVGVLLEEAGALLVEDLERLEGVCQERRARGVRRRLTRGNSRLAATAFAPATPFRQGLGHRRLSVRWALRRS